MRDERPLGLDKWRLLGRLLPPDVRERIFEPALADLMRVHVTRTHLRKGVPFGVHAVGTYLGCVPSAIKRLLVDRGRLTWLARASLFGVVVVAAAAVWLTRYDSY